MKRLNAALFSLSVVLLYFWNPVNHGHCSEQIQLGLQNEPQTASDMSNQQDESEENRENDKDLLQDPPAAPTIEHQTQTHTTDEPQTQESASHDTIHKDFHVDEAPAEAAVPEPDPESSVSPETDTDSPNTLPVFSLPDAAVTESQSVYVSDDVSLTATASPAPSACSDDADDSCSSSPSSLVSPTAACDAGENPSYDAELNSLPQVLENGSTPGTGKGTKAGLGSASKGTNASSMLKEQNVPAAPETDPALSGKDAEDIPTFDEWKKIIMEVENEKSQTAHTSYNGGAGAVKKVQKTTNYASVECGAKILASNPEAKSTSAILMENVDVYMLNPCSKKIWFVIELCQPIQVKQLDIANFELFSSTPKDFLVSISDRYPTNKWAKLGTFHARDERTVQSFPLDEHLYAKYVKMFTKYIKVELLSHFGSEHFCPLSLIRLFGTSMMEEYELNSDPSERLNLQDEDDDYPPGYGLLDDKSSNNLIGSAKDAIFNMVTNIAANVLGGNSEDGAQSGEDNSSSVHLNLTETSETPEQTISPTSTKLTMESLEMDPHKLDKITETPLVAEGKDEGQTTPLPTASLPSDTAPPSTPQPVWTTSVTEDQIVTLLADYELDESDKTSNSVSKEEEKEKAPQNQQYTAEVEEMVNFWEDMPVSCSWVVSLKEYLLHSCIPVPVCQRKKAKRKSPKIRSQPDTLHQTEPRVPVMISSSSSSSLMQDLLTWTVEEASPMPTSVLAGPSFPEHEHRLVAGSLELSPSLTSALVTLVYPETVASRATHVVDFLDPSVVEHSELKLNGKSKEKPVEDKNTASVTSNLKVVSTPESDVVAHVPALEISNTETNTLTTSITTSTMDQATVTPPSTITDQTFVQSNISKSVTPAVTLTASPVAEPLEAVSVVTEAKVELVDEAARADGHSGNVHTETYSNGQSVQPSSSDFYAEIPSSTDAPTHGSNQKESVFMRLNNRIKALEVNMSLSSRYLEQLSQRYRKQMEEMQKAFNKTIIKLQNTSTMAEEQDQKQTESIQLLQKQLENVTRLVLNLSLHVSQLQNEVSDRHSYLLLCVILGLLICIIICVNYCRMSAENLSTEPDTSVPNSYSYCSPDRDSPDSEDKNPKRRASYPFSHSSRQITTTEGPNEAYNVETRRNSTGNKKKKRCKMKPGRKPETITPVLLSTTSVPNGGLQCNQHRPHNLDLKLDPHIPSTLPFTFRDSPSEGSSGDSSQSDEPSFCGIASCSHLCDPLPTLKNHSKKGRSLRKKGTVLERLLQPVECNGPPVASKFTLHGLITGSKDMSMNRAGVPLLPRVDSFD